MKRTIIMLAVIGVFLFVQTAQADWLPTKRLTWNSGYSSRPAVGVDSNGIHIVNHDWTPGNIEIY
jgi:hypothetical protein